MSAIAKVYWRTIQRGTRTLADVPENLRGAVTELTEAELESGKIDQETYERMLRV